MIAMYDLEDNLITVFDNYDECAKYFNTSKKSLECYICRSKKGIVDKKRDGKNWCRLFKIDEREEE